MAAASVRSADTDDRRAAPGLVDYLTAWQLQRELADARVAGGPDTLLLLEHPAVYTAGKRTEPHERPVASARPSSTPIAAARSPGTDPASWSATRSSAWPQPLDVVKFVRRLEDSLIAVCASLGLATGRVEGRSGVWVPADDGRPARKIAAIGIRVARATTLHGFALNCDCDLSAFTSIVPCGIADAGVTSLTAELGRRITVDDVADAVADAVRDALDGRPALALTK